MERTAFDRRAHRAGGAFGTAIAAHVIILLSVWGMARVDPAVALLPTARRPQSGRSSSPGAPATAAAVPPAATGRRIPVALVRTRGADARAIPVARGQSLATPDTIAPEREPAPSLPVMPMNAGDLPQVGAVDGVPGPPTAARGPGDGGVGTRTGNDRGVGGVPGDGIGEGPYRRRQRRHRAGPRLPDAAAILRRRDARQTAGRRRVTGIVGVDGRLHDIRIARSLDPTSGSIRAIAASASGAFARARAGPRRPRLRDDRGRLQPPLNHRRALWRPAHDVSHFATVSQAAVPRRTISAAAQPAGTHLPRRSRGARGRARGGRNQAGADEERGEPGQRQRADGRCRKSRTPPGNTIRPSAAGRIAIVASSISRLWTAGFRRLYKPAPASTANAARSLNGISRNTKGGGSPAPRLAPADAWPRRWPRRRRR